MNNYHSVTLSVSNKKLNCNNIINYLKHINIMASVTENKSITPDGIENGCNILLPYVNKDTLQYQIWEPLKRRHNLSCAHLNVPGTYSGCIYDFIMKTNCPSRLKEEAKQAKQAKQAEEK